MTRSVKRSALTEETLTVIRNKNNTRQYNYFCYALLSESLRTQMAYTCMPRLSVALQSNIEAQLL